MAGWFARDCGIVPVGKTQISYRFMLEAFRIHMLAATGSQRDRATLRMACGLHCDPPTHFIHITEY